MSPPISRDLLALDDLTTADITAIVERAQDMAKGWSERRLPQRLAGKRVALVVNDGGWRNTTAFDLGIRSMGGLCIHAPLSLEGREAVADLAAYLDNWFDAIVIRAPQLAALRALAAAADAGVINGRTRQNHPCEVLGDLAFRHRRQAGGRPMKIAVVAPDANILGSWVELAAVMPLTVVQVYPEPWHAHAPQLTGARFRTSTDMDELVDADVIVTDCWPEGADPETLHRYRITATLLDRLRPATDFLPCPPVTRGREVSEDAMTHPLCRVVEAKAFLLHTQNAALEWCFGV